MKIKTSLLLSCLLCVELTACASISKVQADTGRQRRSDDPSPLQAVVSQLVARVTKVEAEATALQTELNSVKTKRCETGRSGLSPHDKTETINGLYHERRHTRHVKFAHPFNKVPWVAVSLGTIDESNDDNLRVGSGATGISTTGFDAFVYEWAGTHLFGVTVTWIACDM